MKLIRIIHGYTAGTGTDVMARMVAQKLSESLGQPVVVENRVGASGSMANERVATSPADGYTLLMCQASCTILPALRTKLPYDLTRDFTGVSLVATSTYVLVVHPSVPARDVKELITIARATPGKLSYGSAGVGTSSHLAGELFNLMAKVSILHVPYKGTPEFAVANASGQVDLGFSSITPALPLLSAGKLRALAVTSGKRTSLMPSTPSLNELGLAGYNRVAWFGVLAPAAVPKDIVGRLNAVIVKAFNTAEAKEQLYRQGLEPQTTTPEQCSTFVREEVAQNGKLIRLIGIKPEN
ncbi:MAG: tripartite tricarboxylate transporter substrate binding protein [Betaproteobacteria bacterium]|nr:tripartite tricarboxylate transporter substrate binding protein [Betaproteobacteria bacterium]